MNLIRFQASLENFVQHVNYLNDVENIGITFHGLIGKRAIWSAGPKCNCLFIAHMVTDDLTEFKLFYLRPDPMTEDQISQDAWCELTHRLMRSDITCYEVQDSERNARRSLSSLHIPEYDTGMTKWLFGREKYSKMTPEQVANELLEKAESNNRYGDEIVPNHRKKVITHPTILQTTSFCENLIITTRKVEAQAVRNVFSTGREPTLQKIGKTFSYNLGIHGGIPVFMVQSGLGSATPGGALLIVSRAIEDLYPHAIIMCGIAFGLRKDGQELGDILISQQISCYEPQKIDSQQGQISRGDRATATSRLLQLFQNGELNWQGAKPRFGIIVSGEKLVNDPGFRERLLEMEPEAIGGDMEGAGLYVAANEAKVDWILVKAVCDWADGSKNDDAQQLAANNAAQFVLHVLQSGGWVESA